MTSRFHRQALAAVLGFVLPALGAVESASLDLRVRHWTTEQGLPQNRISCLKQTRDGYLWIGTWFGLVRFDGIRFTVFNKSNTAELVDDTISSLEEDESGTLWIGT